MKKADHIMIAENRSEQYAVVNRTVPTFYFIGVTTTKSSINRVFPLWAKALGRPDVVLEGVDCRLNDDPANYRLRAHLCA